MKITRLLPLIALPLVIAGCGGAGGGGLGSNSPIAATYRTSFDRGAVVTDDTTMVLFIDKQAHVGAQISDSTEVLFAGQGSIIGNNLIISMNAVSSSVSGTVLVQGAATAGDPPNINITLSGSISANVVATQISGDEVVLTAGTYNGTFDGEDSGTFTIQVADDGEVSGTVNSSLNGDNLAVVGDVDLSGRIQFGYQDAGSDGVFEGYLFVPVGQSAFKGGGEWHFDELDGDWAATKPAPV